MRSLLDVNFLLALFQPDHVHYEPAQRWWTAHRAGGWASCPLTQNGFVRIVSQSRYPKPMALTIAIELFAEQTIDTDHEFWPDDISVIDLQRFNRTGILGPKQLTDVYLLALAVKNGGRLATFDRAIPLGAVRGAQAQHVAVI
jgi:toxin-antitoxin system PIN domain toxin